MKHANNLRQNVANEDTCMYKKYQCIIVPVKARTCCEFTATESIILTIHIHDKYPNVLF